MYLGPPAREDAGKIAPQPAQGVVPQPRRGHYEGGRRGHLPSEAAAALSAGATGVRRVAGLSVPCLASADAPAPHRNRSVQVRRVQAERIRQADPKPELLAAWA